MTAYVDFVSGFSRDAAPWPFRSRYDRALCLHEAGHAVTGEVLRPGCVLGVEIDLVPGRPTRYTGQVFGAGIGGVCEWEIWYSFESRFATAVAAGREAEKIAEYWEPLDLGDRRQLRWYGWTGLALRKRRRAAARIVRDHELAVRRVASALGQKRALSGDEVRELMGRYA